VQRVTGDGPAIDGRVRKGAIKVFDRAGGTRIGAEPESPGRGRQSRWLPRYPGLHRVSQRYIL
jgi:hypothetical protein